MSYADQLVAGFWRYQQERFPDRARFFDKTEVSVTRPPVLLPEHRDENVLVNPSDTPGRRSAVLRAIPSSGRHRWFGSMKSSQAIAQSVFANLAVAGLLDVLRDVMDDDGGPLLPPEALTSGFAMEHSVSHLGERNATSLDVFFDGPFKVAFECKLTEAEVGACSRPTLEPKEAGYCDGTFPLIRPSAADRCSLTTAKVRYWDYVPRIFNWALDRDHAACPLRGPYQLVRNILAVCVGDDETITSRGRAVLVYDERNPAFQTGGDGAVAFAKTKAALKPEFAGVLTKCSWQGITARLRAEASLQWLTSELHAKYGL